MVRVSKDRRGISVDPEVNEYLGRDGVNASELIESLVREHMKIGDTQTVALEVQIRQKERELESTEERVEALKRDIAELRELQGQLASEDDEQLDAHLAALNNTPLDPTNPAIMNHAKTLDITPQELVRELEEYRNEAP